MTTDPIASGDLAVSKRRWVRWLWLPLLAVIAGVAWWWALHPSDLPHSDRVVTAQVKAGQTVYLGVPVGDIATRKLKVHGVEVTSRSTPETSVSTSVWVCTEGSISQTTTPEAFCAKWSTAKDTTVRLGGGDQLVLGVSATSATAVTVENIEVDFTDGLQRGSSSLGPRFEVTFLG